MAHTTLGAHTFGCVWDMDAAAAVDALAAEGSGASSSSPCRRIWTRDAPPRLSSGAHRRAVEQVHGEVLALDLPSNDINLASTSVDVVDFNVESYSATIRLAGELGARWVVVLPGRRHLLLPPHDDRLLSIYRAAMGRLVRLAESCGVRLLIENHPQTLLPDARSIADFLTQERYGRVDSLYDIANGFAIGEDT